MSRIHIPTTGPNNWQYLPADPQKHWRPGYSAYACAHAWERADGWPGFWRCWARRCRRPTFATN